MGKNIDTERYIQKISSLPSQEGTKWYTNNIIDKSRRQSQIEKPL